MEVIQVNLNEPRQDFTTAAADTIAIGIYKFILLKFGMAFPLSVFLSERINLHKKINSASIVLLFRWQITE